MRYSLLPLLLICASALAIAQPYSHPQAVTKEGIVITCQPLAAEAGLEVLHRGGNAADAFIATTLAEYVTAYGYTSLSGPLNLLYYDAQKRNSEYLNAGINKVSDPAGQFDPNHPTAGQAYVIGGAGRGLEALYKRYGSHRLAFRDLVNPAVALARVGFPLSRPYEFALQSRAPLFQNSPEWLATYTHGGTPFHAGDYLVQLALADTLTHYGDQGADYLFQGKFARDLVAKIRAAGGKLSIQDLENYQVYWSKPLAADYRGYRVESGSYRSVGGLQTLLALKTIENFSGLGQGPHFSIDEGVFDKVLRAYLFSLQTSLGHYYPFTHRLDSLADQEAVLEGQSANDPSPAALWKKVIDPTAALPFSSARGHDSCDAAVIDRAGNIAAGNHTIYSREWGDYGLMVDGVSLNSAWSVAVDAPPGERAIDLLAPILIFKDAKPWTAAGYFDSSLMAGAFETLLDLMDYGMTPRDALFAPRFGTPLLYQPLTIPLDPRYPASWVEDFLKQGVIFQQPKNAAGAVDLAAYVDSGDGMILRIDPGSGIRYGAASEVLIEAVAASE